ncbi:asparaginase [Corynebacterium resistens]
MTNPSRIHVLSTGGTISCLHDENGDLIPTLSCADLINRAGFATGSGHPTITGEDIMTVDSSDITLEDIDFIIDRIRASATDSQINADAVVVLHGTDTMEETAFAVARLCGELSCPVVFTGAQRPADDDNPDGPLNLRAAVATAVKLLHFDTSGPCVRIAFGGQVLPAVGTTKWHTTDDEAFHHAENVDDFAVVASSQDGTIPRLAGLNVPIIDAYAGADGTFIEQLAATGIDGLVISALGSGNVPATMATALRALDVPVLVSTRVPEGGVHFVYGSTGGGADLARQGIRSAGNLRPSQARMWLLTELAVRA